MGLYAGNCSSTMSSSPVLIRAFYRSLLVAALIAASSAGPNEKSAYDEIVPEDNQPISIEKSARIAVYCEGCIGQSLIATDKIFSHCADGTGICEMPDHAEWEKLQRYVMAEGEAQTRLAPEHKKDLLTAEVKMQGHLEEMGHHLEACVESRQSLNDSSNCNRNGFQNEKQSFNDIAATNKALCTSIYYSLNQRAGVMQQQLLSLEESVQGKCAE